MKEFTYYSVWGEIDEDAKEIKIMGTRIEYQAHEIINFEKRHDPDYYHVVSRSYINHIINIENEMNKSLDFINNLIKKLEKELDRMQPKK